MKIYNNEIDKRKCAKRTIIAVIVNNGKYWVGSNWCNKPQDICPRQDMKTGEGYGLCGSICEQNSHAEVDACRKAGAEARNGALLLFNHYYCCDNCKEVIDGHGIKSVIVVDDGKI